MIKGMHITTKEQNQVDAKIDTFFAFVQDVIDDPSTLDRIPDRATIELTPIARRRRSKSYATETRRFAVSVRPVPGGSATRPAKARPSTPGIRARRPAVHARVVRKHAGSSAYLQRSNTPISGVKRDTSNATLIHPDPKKRSA